MFIRTVFTARFISAIAVFFMLSELFCFQDLTCSAEPNAINPDSNTLGRQIILSWVEIEQREHKNLIKVQQDDKDRTKKNDDYEDIWKPDSKIELEKPIYTGKELMPPETGPKAEQEAKPSLSSAWQYYGLKKYAEAIEIFTKLIAYSEFETEAKYGLAMSYSKLKESGKAIPLFEELVARKIHFHDSVQELMKLLVGKKEYQKASSYLNLFDQGERQKWEETIKVSYLRSKVEKVKGTEDIEKIDELLVELRNEEKSHSIASNYKSKLLKIKLLLLNEKILTLKPDFPEIETVANEILTFIPGDKTALTILAWRYFNLKRYEEASERFYKLQQAYPADISYAEGLSTTMVKLGKNDEALKLLEPYRDNEKFAAVEKDIKLLILREKLSTRKPDSTETEDIAREILSIEPGDKWASTVLAWLYFNKRRYEEAYAGFSELHESYPQDRDFASGLVNTMVKLGKNDEALNLAEKWRGNEKLSSIEAELKLMILTEKLYGSDLTDAEKETTAKEILSIRPFDEGVRVTLAWLYYTNESYEKAYEEFFALVNTNALNKDYTYGLVNTLVKLGRTDEAIAIALKHKKEDERFANVETEIYLNKAQAAYENKKYREAEINYEKVLAADPDDEDIKKKIALSRYNQTIIGKALSFVEGLPGHSWGNITHDLNGTTGTGISAMVNQGIDWFKLPGDIMFNTFVEYRYSTRSNDRRYFDANGHTLGIELRKYIFNFGAEHSWEKYRESNTTYVTNKLYLSWYQDWYKYLKSGDKASFLGIQALTGETQGRITHDLGNRTGTSISGHITTGIDWFTLPKGIVFNSYAEYRFSFRTKDNVYYDAHGPALGIEFQKKPFRLGMDHYWQSNPKQHTVDKQWRFYFSWYYDWDLKQIAEQKAEAALIGKIAVPFKPVEAPETVTAITSEAKPSEVKEAEPEPVPAKEEEHQKPAVAPETVTAITSEAKPSEVKEAEPEPVPAKEEEPLKPVVASVTVVLEPPLIVQPDKTLEPAAGEASEAGKPSPWGYLKLLVPEKVLAGEDFIAKVQAYDTRNNMIKTFPGPAKEFHIAISKDDRVEPIYIITAEGAFYIKVRSDNATKISVEISEAGNIVTLLSKDITIQWQ